MTPEEICKKRESFRRGSVEFSGGGAGLCRASISQLYISKIEGRKRLVIAAGTVLRRNRSGCWQRVRGRPNQTIAELKLETLVVETDGYAPGRVYLSHRWRRGKKSRGGQFRLTLFPSGDPEHIPIKQLIYQEPGELPADT